MPIDLNGNAGASVAVVGASLAGVHAVTALRREGFPGRIVLIGEEAEAPYDRPPLSKEILRGELEVAHTRLPFSAAALNVEQRLGCRAVSLDAETLELTFDDGRSERFDGLVLATGAAPRTLDGGSFSGVHVVRTLDDSVALAADLAAGPSHVAIIGGGFIGAEVAASCRDLKLDVTLLEALSEPMERALGPQLGSHLARFHRERGVDVRVGVTVTRLDDDKRGRIKRLHLSDGTWLDADVVVVAIGVDPCTDWLEGSGLMIEHGVVCDETCLAAPGIVAAGDVARWPNPRYDEVRRIEHWDNAIRQAEHAVRRLLSEDPDAVDLRYAPIPWVWSDQYGSKLQLLGSSDAYDEVTVFSGADDRLTALFRREDRLIGAFFINATRDMVRCRRLLEADASWDEAISTLATDRV